MSLTSGARLGVYDITAQIGEGGMGQVFQATDTKLKRQVAIKILPPAVAADADRLARFQREAEVLASLNHPNIAGIYGLEETGGLTALVMELVEGDDLSQRIARGAIPIDEALPIAKQIAEALEAAHEQGIIHRDLKPANIKVRPDGTVKVLDFGLAKAMEPAGAMSPSMSMSPTITTPAMTQAGIILGTAAYMSPEQAKGREVDKRSDIWSFGCVLYEMLAGRRVFEGDDVADTLASVLKGQPDWIVLPSDVSLPIRILLRRCLEKDRRKRLADIATAIVLIEETPSLTTLAPQEQAFVQKERDAVRAQIDAAVSSARRETARSTRRRVALISVSAWVIVGSMAVAATWFLMRPAVPRIERFTIASAGTAELTINDLDRPLAITPDGTRVFYIGNNGTQLFARTLDQLEPRAIFTGTGPRGVFVSPDGQWVGFFDGASTLKKVAITGGPAVTLAQINNGPRGAAWAPDDTIIFGEAAPATGLQRVSAAGGETTVLTKPDRERGEGDHVWPAFLPGGEAVLFTIVPLTLEIDNAQVAVLDLRTGMSKVLIRGGSDAHYVSTGHLIYAVAGTLRAVAFDLRRLEVVGTPVPVLEGVMTTVLGAAGIAVAANGALVYIPGGAAGGGQLTVVSVDRQGRPTPLPGIPLNSYRDVRVSPDGARLALATQSDVWIYDLARGTLGRLTTDPASDRSPLWTPDGQRIVFTSNRNGYPELFWRPADGTGSDERFLARAKDLTDLRGNGWSADGRQLLFTEVSATSAIGQIAVERPSEAKLLVKSDSPSPVSPDGGWIAYQSTVSGRTEIYVEKYPELGSRQLMSTGGGQRPLWSRDGRELFFIGPDSRQMFAVPVQSGTTLVTGRPHVLFELPMLVSRGNRPYDIALDGRFLIIRSAQAEIDGGPASNLILVQNWFEELKRLVPTN